MVDVSQLVSQMHETLSNIHSTISSLSVLDHEQRLDDLEQRRAAAVAALQSGFSLESDDLARKRQTQREALLEQRRREDEEREARRRQEDEALQAQLADEDRTRHDKLDADTREVETSTDAMMGNVEEEAKKMLEEGKAKLAALEERRRELNRLIDEQLQMPLPSVTSRRKARDQALPEMVAASNPVDIFDKRTDHGDGDRDALAAPEPSPAYAVIVEQESKVNITPAVAEEPVSTAIAPPETSNSSFDENQKYLQDVTSHIVPGGFPTSALQSPTSENMDINTMEAAEEPVHQSLAEVIATPQVVHETEPVSASIELHEDAYEYEAEQEEMHSDMTPTKIQPSKHDEPSIPNSPVMITEAKVSASQFEIEAPLEPQIEDRSIAEIVEEHDLQTSLPPQVEPGENAQHDEPVVPSNPHPEAHEEELLYEEPPQEHEDAVHDEPPHEELVHEKSVSEETVHEEPPHEDLPHEDLPHEIHETPVEQGNHELNDELVPPAADSNIPSIAIHTTEMTEKDLHETSLETKPSHEIVDEVAQESSIETTTLEHIVEPQPHEVEGQTSTDPVPPELRQQDTEAEAAHEASMDTLVAAIPETEEQVPETVEKAAHYEEHSYEESSPNEPIHEDVHELAIEETHEIFRAAPTQDNHAHDKPAPPDEPPIVQSHKEEKKTPVVEYEDEHTNSDLISPSSTVEQISEEATHDETVHEEPSHESPLGVTHDEVAHDEISLDEISHEDFAHEDVTHDEVAHDEAARDEVARDEVAHDEISHDEISRDEILRDEISRDEISRDEISHEDFAHEDVTHEEVTNANEELTHEEVTHGKISHDETAHNELHEAPHKAAKHTDISPEVSGNVIEKPEVSAHDLDGHLDVDPTRDLHEHNEAHEGLQEETPEAIDNYYGGLEYQQEPAIPNNVNQWHYQEPYVAQEAYSYPYAVSQEYVDYGSSYYASAQQSLDPSPVFHEVHEAFDEPVLDETMIFGADPSAPSLDKELRDLEVDDEEPEEQEEETLHAPASFQEVLPQTHHETAPEAENAATMHGQDDLFDDDSDGSAGSVESADSEDHGHKVEHQFDDHGHDLERDAGAEEQLLEAQHEIHSHETDIPHTPTTIVGDSHYTEEEPERAPKEEIVEAIVVAGERPVTPDVPTPVASQFKGLANSRHAPQYQQPQQQQVPVTPPGQTAATLALSDDDILGEAEFMPRDVTNVSWRERGSISSTSIDATPGSVRSQTTLSTSASSSFSSPSPWSAAVVAAAATHKMGSLVGDHGLRQDDPFIRNSWSGTPDSHGHNVQDEDSLILGRGRPLGRQLDYDGTIVDPEKKALALETVQLPPSTNSRPSSIATSSPSSLFQRMRSIFEPPNGGAATGNTSMLPKSVTTATANLAGSLRDPYPATGNTVRGVKIEGIEGKEDDDNDDHINEKSSLLQSTSTVGMPSY
ncbi:hypothetical protein SEUCBS139899_001018 [Sporothrix eucalyptigena]